ncbi:MAG: hypothetical protein ACRC2O_14160 [Chitinophagaceae bacterium]
MLLTKWFSDKRLFLPFAIVLFLSLYSCSSVRLIQEYDEITDHKLTSVQEKIARFFVKMERQIGMPESKYEKYIDFYDDVKTDLSVLEVRSRAIPKSEIVQQQLKLVQSQISNLEKLHKLGFNSYEELNPIRNALDNSFAAMIQLQMSLKNRIKL